MKNLFVSVFITAFLSGCMQAADTDQKAPTTTSEAINGVLTLLHKGKISEAAQLSKDPAYSSLLENSIPGEEKDGLQAKYLTSALSYLSAPVVSFPSPDKRIKLSGRELTLEQIHELVAVPVSQEFEDLTAREKQEVAFTGTRPDETKITVSKVQQWDSKYSIPEKGFPCFFVPDDISKNQYDLKKEAWSFYATTVQSIQAPATQYEASNAFGAKVTVKERDSDSYDVAWENTYDKRFLRAQNQFFLPMPISQALHYCSKDATTCNMRELTYMCLTSGQISDSEQTLDATYSLPTKVRLRYHSMPLIPKWLFLIDTANNKILQSEKLNNVVGDERELTRRIMRNERKKYGLEE